ncbi:glycoside hydrolase family 97 catalytic domain-containing protein [Pedobacter sp. P351]|uniref:glycoside hydrolase family 97 protein n=1 Tax=Pedobacter superstes TaxID=3133441 RepID=UPI0030B5FD07
MEKHLLLLGLVLINLLPAVQAQKLVSPDKRIVIQFSVDSLKPTLPAYQVFYRGRQFLRPSAMGFHIAGQATFYSLFNVTDIKRKEQRGSWRPVYGERDTYRDDYNQMEITLQEKILPNRILKVVFRAYNEGIAFRYEFPDQPAMKDFTIVKEVTEFAFPANTYVWAEHGHEGLYNKVLVSAVKPDCELPLTILTPDNIYAAIAEGGSSDYPRAYLQNSTVVANPFDSVSIALRNRRRGDPNALSITLRGEAKGKGNYVTAWRMITLADKPGGLLEQNYLLLNLNAPSKITDPSWIKPGKAIRDITLSTNGGKKYIDYAQKQGIDHVILDWGWYGPPNGEDSDPSFINVVNPGTGRPIPDHTGLDMKELVSYGKSKGVGIFLYVNRQGLERYMDKIFPIYEAWGIKGIKPGFINVGNQEWQQWVDTLVKKAADHHLMVDIHDAYRPTGLSRTYPNLLSQEGIRGNEHTPDANHNTNLPFTRYTIGAGDYTPGYCRSTLQNTWTHRLALPIIFYSPGQFLFWGEPLNEECHGRPELALWKEVPVAWDDTKVLDGAIGEYAVIARRKGNDWYIGGITNKTPRTLQLDLNFLDGNKKYEATIYQDNENVQKVLISKKTVNRKTILPFLLQASGGFAVQLKAK